MSLIRFPDVAKRTALSRVTIWRLEREGRFPKRVQLGTNSVAWVEAEVDEWIAGLPRSGGRPAPFTQSARARTAR